MLLTGASRRATALSIAQELAARIAAEPFTRRHPASLSQGGAGFAMLYAALGRISPENGWNTVGHRFLADAVKAGAAGRAGLFDGGIAGLGVAAASLRGSTGAYERLLGRTDAAVAAVPDHDLVSGTAGAGLYLLLRPPGAKREDLLAALVRSGGASPPYPMPAHRIPAGWTVAAGYADCGLAHGVAGALAVLALLARDGGVAGTDIAEAGGAGTGVPDRSGTIRQVADWLLAQAGQDEWGTFWPAGVDGATRYPSARRASWCYGVPGAARALWLAGDAVGEPRYRRVATEAMERLLAAPEAWGLDTPGICHGWAGLMLISAAFGLDAAANELFDRLCAGYDGRRPLGFDVPGPGLLTGAAGIALALLTVTAGDRFAASLFLAA
ncbi:lanthionine synthetase C family protein [Nonomuraea glycinis]|uniref:lanthionine synthetase C family protein n=1 Tax=Nonomuraea glycinis TaxID=2047744 RepID=UPI002E124509|nr:lanthionine synthetase C family protein [Nonomuraea glycinis]